MLTRAVTGALVGWVGGILAVFASLSVSHSYCNTHLDWVQCTAEDVGLGNTLADLTLAGGLVVMALVHGGLLKLCRRPRPWSVVVPEIVLTAGLYAIPGIGGLGGAFYLPGAVFAVTGVLTGFRRARPVEVL